MAPGFPYVTLFLTLYLTFDTAVAVIRAHDDISEVAVILSVYVIVVLLILFMRAYERREGSERRERLKIPIWTLLTVIQVVFAYRVSTILPLVWDLLVWILVGFISLISYYFFFIYPIRATVVLPLYERVRHEPVFT